MAKVNLDVPDDLHLKIKREQLDREGNGAKGNLKELYYEILREGIEAINQKKTTQS